MSSERLVQFIGVASLSLSLRLSVSLCLVYVFSLSCRHISILLSVAPRWFQRSDRGGVPRRVLSILCIVEQLRPTPRIRAICEYTRSPSATFPLFDLFHRFAFSFSRSLSPFFFCPFLFFSYLSVSFSPRYRGADVISCSVGLQMHPR